MPSQSEIRRFFGLLRPELPNYAVGLTSLFLVNVFDVLAPIFLAVAIDLVAAAVGGPEPSTPPLLRLIGVNAADLSYLVAIGLFFAMQVGANGFRYPMLMFSAVPSHRIGQTLRNAVTDRLLRLSMPFYDRAKSGDLMSRATNDINQVRMMMGPGVLVGIDTIMLVSLVIGVMLSLSWKLTLVAMAPIPIIGLVTNWLSHAEYERWEKVQDDLSILTERARESFAGIRVIQAYAREAFDRARFRERSERHLEKQLELARVRSVFMPTLFLMMGLSTSLILLFGGTSVVRGNLSVGTFVAFLFLIGFVSGPMMGFGWSVSLFQRGRASLARIDELLAERVDIVESPEALDAAGPGAISIRGLTFTYPTRREDDAEPNADVPEGGPPDAAPRTAAPASPALRNIDLEIPAGSTLGIIGPVGSGKSTIASLIVRLYDPPKGTVFLDGVDVRDLAIDSLRQSVVVAPQDTFLFSDTVARNIALGDETGVDVEGAARLAHLHEEILDLEYGYETMLGERGVNLSGGQRQRLAIARSIAADPRVLVLDDCLSAVDAKTEEAILANLRDVFDGRTGIVISHRVCAVQDCDQIIVLDEGRVTERGPHDALVAAGGYYARIAAEQGMESATVEEP